MVIVKNHRFLPHHFLLNGSLYSLTDLPEKIQFQQSCPNGTLRFWGLLLWFLLILNRSHWFKNCLWLKWSKLIDPHFHFRFLIHLGKYNLSVTIAWCHTTEMRCIYLHEWCTWRKMDIISWLNWSRSLALRFVSRLYKQQRMRFIDSSVSMFFWRLMNFFKRHLS